MSLDLYSWETWIFPFLLWNVHTTSEEQLETSITECMQQGPPPRLQTIHTLNITKLQTSLTRGGRTGRGGRNQKERHWKEPKGTRRSNTEGGTGLTSQRWRKAGRAFPPRAAKGS